MWTNHPLIDVATSIWPKRCSIFLRISFQIKFAWIGVPKGMPKYLMGSEVTLQPRRCANLSTFSTLRNIRMPGGGLAPMAVHSTCPKPTEKKFQNPKPNSCRERERERKARGGCLSFLTKLNNKCHHFIKEKYPHTHIYWKIHRKWVDWIILQLE